MRKISLCLCSAIFLTSFSQAMMSSHENSKDTSYNLVSEQYQQIIERVNQLHNLLDRLAYNKSQRDVLEQQIKNDLEKISDLQKNNSYDIDQISKILDQITHNENSSDTLQQQIENDLKQYNIILKNEIPNQLMIINKMKDIYMEIKNLSPDQLEIFLEDNKDIQELVPNCENTRLWLEKFEQQINKSEVFLRNLLSNN